MLRMVNLMVDSYLELRRELSAQLDHWQHELLQPRTQLRQLDALMAARDALHALEDLCEDQRDAMQEWLDDAARAAAGPHAPGASATRWWRARAT